MIVLRDYQQAAKNALYAYLDKHPDGAPCVVLPTGAGKTPLLASVCADIVSSQKRVVVVSHVKELLQQAADKLAQFIDKDSIGIYSAGLGEKCAEKQVTVAGIQSIYAHAAELGNVRCIIIDEAHLINSDAENSMYITFINNLREISPNLRIIGLTATPYRMTQGYIYGEGRIFDTVVYDVSVKQLIMQDYLCKVKMKSSRDNTADLTGVHTRGGEYIESEAEAAMQAITAEACAEIREITHDRHSVLVFCQTVRHAKKAASILGNDRPAAVVYGNMDKTERAAALEQFKNGAITYLCNVNVLTTGFDAPNVDAIALLRATCSPGLYYQMVGRGLRKHESKQDCIVLDFGGNVARHGPIDSIQIRQNCRKSDKEIMPKIKTCPYCEYDMSYEDRVCPVCGKILPERKTKINLDAKAADGEILSGGITDTEYNVLDVCYFLHEKKKNDGTVSATMEVRYKISLTETKSEYICIGHSNAFARKKADAWWMDRCWFPPPDDIAQAVELAERGFLLQPEKITIRKISGEKYTNIINYKLPEQKTQTEKQELLQKYQHFVENESADVFDAFSCGCADTPF